jgi:uncharacterized protein (TIGR03067 family)
LPAPSASELDLRALQGTWKQVAFEEDDNPDAPDSYGDTSGSLTTFRGNHFSVRGNSGQLLLEGTFALDASTTPKSIDWTDSIGADAGKTLPAIYELEGDHFVFVAADEHLPRPAEFRTAPGLTMRSFLRLR